MLSIPEYRFHLSRYAKSAKTNQPNLIKRAKKCQFHPASRFVEYLEILSPKSKNNPIFGIYAKFPIEKVVLVYFLVEDLAGKKPCKDYDAIHEPVPTAHAQTGERARLPSPSGGKIQC